MCGCGCELAASRELLNGGPGAPSAGAARTCDPLGDEWQGWWGEFVSLLHDLAPSRKLDTCVKREISSATRISPAPVAGGTR